MKAAGDLSFTGRLPQTKRGADSYGVFEDGAYRVAARETRFDPDGPVWTHLVISRHDGQPVHSWDDLQRIKSDLCGEESEAIELYPSQARLVDRTNTYHLWVLPEGERLWVGMEGDDDSGIAERWWTFTPWNEEA